MKNILTLLFFSALVGNASAQLNIRCDGADKHALYLLYSNSIYRIDSIDTNPGAFVYVQSAPGISGISINRDFNGPAGSLAMYGAGGGEYYYWNSTNWVDTHHTTGSITAINPGGSTDLLFNYDGFGEALYKYDGTQNGTLLMSGLSLQGWDVACDSSGNFYLFYSSMVVAYTPNAIPVDTIYAPGAPSGTLAGFAILNSRMYIVTGLSLYEGIISPDGKNVNFNQIYSLPVNVGDIASCPDAASGSQILTGFKNPDAPHFIIYPNPANDYAVIKLDNTTAIYIADCLGKKILTADVRGLTQYELETSGWASGIYFVTATSTKGIAGHTTLVVK